MCGILHSSPSERLEGKLRKKRLTVSEVGNILARLPVFFFCFRSFSVWLPGFRV